ncbi:HEAT repeat domain-containing protein [Streptomyces sp. NBC_00233]|uniref:HEAT repeat domain-containing protein n=1 Tax=Streptomyces sp. NBC_00233 TaxID=2975686 RepID=UPI0022560084|nr:HEAT repeat domain-containing protein [Streptomyces sp. NBC_00233]MCX5231776.1 HEAT repeat domain-containing protein [Streptomyces sp. NBC_00233]
MHEAVGTGMSLRALDAAVWDGLETGSPSEPVEDVRRALRRLATAGAAAKEEDTHPLYSLIARDGCEPPSAAAVALPFVIALAADPVVPVKVRCELVDVLVAMQAPALNGEDWSGAWALLADPDPAMRRAGMALAAGTERLLERWRVETDPAVRLPLLLALGREAAAGRTGEQADEVRAVPADLLDTDDPVLWVAAVHASAGLDRDLPLRHVDRLIEVLSDLALRPRFEEVWYSPNVDDPWTREDVVRSTAELLAHDAEAELSFVVTLIETSRRSADTALCREALDVAWLLLSDRRSAEAVLLPLAGELLTDADGPVRLRAANILAVLGPAAAGYADRLADLLDDHASDGLLDGTVREFARWALTRIDDPRALPGLIEQLRAQEEEQGRTYVVSEPRRPDTTDVLIPLHAHADVLLPAMLETIRESGPRARATHTFLDVLEAWGGDALTAALPDLLPLLTDTWASGRVLPMLSAMGPAAASAEPALCTCRVPDHPGHHELVARTALRIGEDREAVLRILGEAVMTAEDPWRAPVTALAEFGRGAAPYADGVRAAMENTTHWSRLSAAITLWEITGRVEPTLRVLEEFILPLADGGDDYGLFRDALRALIRMGEVSPAIRTALLTVRQSERRLCVEWAYPRILQDKELRGLVEEALGCASTTAPADTVRTGL